MSPTFVIGHRNPDTDAICSAIGYAAFLRATRDPNAVAACCGELTVRTAWVLQQAGLPAPRLLMDVRPTGATICRRDVFTASADETFLSVYRKMLEHKVRALPVVDAEGRLLGIPTIQDLAQLFLPPDDAHPHNAANREVRTSLKNITAALGGQMLGATLNAEVFDNLLLVVAASSLETTKSRALQFPPSQLAIVTGDRPDIHDLAIELRVRCLIITGGFQPSTEFQVKAKDAGVAIIVSAHDTASTSQLIRFSRPIGEALTTNYQSFSTRTPLAELKAEVQHSHQSLFPVVNEETGKLEGVFSKSDLVDVPRMKLVLVDHNEFAQAVTGADEAEILEVIDHHRLSGNLRTKEPIRFINEPVGSTSTIVALMFRMRGMSPDKATAICLIAGLVSDTLHLTSPTTTDTDREILQWLAQIAGVDTAEFVRDFFAAGSMLKDCVPANAIESDRKEFEENGWRISISQIEELGLSEFWKREDDLRAALEAVCKEKGLHFACLMVTDITDHNSVLLIAGNQRVADAIEYPQFHKRLFEMRGVVSRKKQLFPYLSRIVGKLAAP